MRSLAVELGDPPGADLLEGGNVPGDIVAFGNIQVSDGSARSQTLGGANIVAFVREEAPWVIHYQEIQLRNMALMSTRMRTYEPFFLEPREFSDHARWLWGGGMHVYTASQREFTVEVLVEWLAELMPST